MGQSRGHRELTRVEAIKGQRSANVLTSAKTRRQSVANALGMCPAGEWVSLDDLLSRMRRGSLSPTIAHNESSLWRLYISEARYGSLGYAGFHNWTLLEGRYTLAVLFEYAATLGLIDIAYTDPAGARDDFRENWGRCGLGRHRPDGTPIPERPGSAPGRPVTTQALVAGTAGVDLH